METPDWKIMPGTEGTGEYLVIARNSAGDRVGVRDLSGGSARIRVEPGNTDRAETLASVLCVADGWKQTGENGQNRFSLVGTGDEGREAALGAIDALKQGGGLERNPAQSVRTWRRLFAA